MCQSLSDNFVVNLLLPRTISSVTLKKSAASNVDSVCILLALKSPISSHHNISLQPYILFTLPQDRCFMKAALLWHVTLI